MRRQNSTFFNYQTGSLYEDGHAPETHAETIGRIAQLGFHAIRIQKLARTPDEVVEAVREIGGMRAGLPYDICADDIRAAMGELGGLCGREMREDVLSEIFSRFCVGK